MASPKDHFLCLEQRKLEKVQTENFHHVEVFEKEDTFHVWKRSHSPCPLLETTLRLTRNLSGENEFGIQEYHYNVLLTNDLNTQTN